MKFYSVIIIVLFFFSCSRNNNKNNDINSTFVKTLCVKQDNVDTCRDYVGTIEETSGVMLSFEVGGNIRRTYADIGQKVKAGELLASIDPSELRNAYNATRMAMSQAEDAHRRYGELHMKGSLPDIQWVEVESKYKQAVSAEAIARKKLDDCNLRSPFSGVISEKTADAGMNVLPGQPVFKLLDVQRVKIRVAVPEKEIPHIKKGDPIRLAVNALGGRTYQCEVSEIGVMADPISHTYDVKGEMANNDDSLMPGMVCKVSLKTREEKEGFIVVPVHAVQIKADGGRFVWLVENGLAKMRAVRTGKLHENGVAIVDGLRTGDRVIVDGCQKVSEGTKVEIL